MNTRWYIAQPDWQDGYSFYASFSDDQGKHILQCEPLTWIRQEEGSNYYPSFTLTANDAQQIVNELWRLGLRPKNGAGTLAQVEATTQHLTDMRKIVSKYLKVDL